MAAYAAPITAASGPRIAIIVAGFGLDHAASEAAVRALPAGFTFAVSPYANGLDALLAKARERGDETLISLPMEPRDPALNDAGDHALTTEVSSDENARRLDWALSRIEGYVGATGALGRLRGETFAAQPELMSPVLATVARRGLLYIDPRPNMARAPARVIDDTAPAVAVDAQLAELERTARAHGSALGLLGSTGPSAVTRLAAWANGLAERGVAVVPVSALGTPQ